MTRGGWVYVGGRAGNKPASTEKAETARQAFLLRYPDLALWMDRSYEESNEQGYITVGKLGRVIEAMWESSKLTDGSYNWHRSDNSDELFDLIDDGEEWLTRPHTWCTTLKRTQCCKAQYREPVPTPPCGR